MVKATIEVALAEMAEATIIASFSQRLTRERVHLTHVSSLRVSLASGGGDHRLDAASSRGGGNDRMLQPRVSWPANDAGSHDPDGDAALPTLQVRRSSCDGGQRDRRRPRPGLCRSLGADAASLLHGVNDIMVNVWYDFYVFLRRKTGIWLRIATKLFRIVPKPATLVARKLRRGQHVENTCDQHNPR